MKYLSQFAIILTVTFVAELIKFVLPLPVPASIYGLVLMLLMLGSGVIPLEKVKEAGTFLVDIMTLMFIPAAVGLLESFEALSGIVLPIALTIVLSTVAVMAVTGWTTQAVIRLEKRRRL